MSNCLESYKWLDESYLMDMNKRSKCKMLLLLLFAYFNRIAMQSGIIYNMKKMRDLSDIH
ncbi:hypothetical protein AS203_05220 [Hoylesella enoeca]|uniref:Uncharacterized protein n=1 Tax=Hoylesella enoeca TaxID=76123 RepID=A0A0S2KJR0_9BACT|nr:hypothetical protein AS203_05220 [Hoylesella enoeca]